MKIMILALTIALTSAYAQVGETQKPVVPASQEDVRGLQNELVRMRREAQVAERNAATRSLEERRKALEDNKAAIAATERKLAEKLESIAREAQKASDDQLRTSRIVWFVTGVAGFIGILGVILVIRKYRQTPKVMVVSRAKNLGEEIPDILFDPDKTTIKEALAKKGEQRFILDLPTDGKQVNCVARLEDGEPVVSIEGDPSLNPTAWEKRRHRAKVILTGIKIA